MKTMVMALAVGGLAAVSSAQVVKFYTSTTPFNNPIGIDYHEPTDSVIVSSHYPSGIPSVFERIDPVTGARTPWSNVAGITDEIKLATVRSGNIGGFTTGEMFSGTGIPGQILRVAADGSSSTLPWTTLPGSTGLLRGGLYVDRVGTFGGDLLAVTTSGEIYRVNSAGSATFLANAGAHLEGVSVVPNDPARFGPMAGQLIAGAEGQNRLYLVDPATGALSFYNVPWATEDIDLIEAGSNFIGVNFGTGQLLWSDAGAFQPYVGDLLLTQEFPSGNSGLAAMRWDFANNRPLLTPFTTDPTGVQNAQWEHVTFAPTDIPTPGALAVLGLAVLAGGRRRA